MDLKFQDFRQFPYCFYIRTDQKKKPKIWKSCQKMTKLFLGGNDRKNRYLRDGAHWTLSRESFEWAHRLIRTFLGRYWLRISLNNFVIFFTVFQIFVSENFRNIDENLWIWNPLIFVAIGPISKILNVLKSWDLALSIAFDRFLLQWNCFLVLICLL